MIRLTLKRSRQETEDTDKTLDAAVGSNTVEVTYLDSVTWVHMTV